MFRRAREWFNRLRDQAAKRLAVLDVRDYVILVGLALLWSGLREVYAPAGRIAVGVFLLWFTTIRRASAP